MIDPAHRVWVNHEIYYMSGDATRTQFVRDPVRYCGLLTDPVSGERFRPSANSPMSEFEGRPYYFSSPGTRATFAADPATYANPRRTMPPSEAPASQPAESPSSAPTQAREGPSTQHP